MKRLVYAVVSVALLVLLQAVGAAAAPTTLNTGFTVSLRASTDSTVNQIVVTYGQLKSQPEVWGNYISDSAGINNITNPEEACLTEDGTHAFCPDGTSSGEPGAGNDVIANLRGGDDSFTATSSIGSFEVKGGDGDDLLRGSAEPTSTRGLGGFIGLAFYNGDNLYGQKGDDRLFGDLGGDFLNGGGGDDVLDGGPKAKDDDFPKDDTIDAGPGDDRVLAADHDKDNLIECGPGKHDVAVVDRADPNPKHCEQVRVRG